jgi:hypothetical protein
MGASLAADGVAAVDAASFEPEQAVGVATTSTATRFLARAARLIVRGSP